MVKPVHSGRAKPARSAGSTKLTHYPASLLIFVCFVYFVVISFPIPMKKLLLSFALPALCLPIVSPAGAAPAAEGKLASGVFAVDQLPPIPTPVGVRREVFEAPTATVDKTHCHVTTLNSGASSGAPRKHLQEEIIIVKEGTVEANWDGQSRVAQAGDVIFFAANAITYLRNVGTTPATYYVVYYFTPLTAKE